MIDAKRIGTLQDEWTERWHSDEAGAAPVEDLVAVVIENHRANFDLWHEEDQARDPEASDSEIARVKRAIDRINQRRNDVVEIMDDLLLRSVPPGGDDAPLHSETPGMMIDRMSILALKIYHTREQAMREDATEAHRQKSSGRLAVLEQQRGDLAGCLAQLWREVMAGTRRFRMYRQMKMYNDPEMNPAIYGKPGQTRRG